MTKINATRGEMQFIDRLGTGRNLEDGEGKPRYLGKTRLNALLQYADACTRRYSWGDIDRFEALTYLIQEIKQEGKKHGIVLFPERWFPDIERKWKKEYEYQKMIKMEPCL